MRHGLCILLLMVLMAGLGQAAPVTRDAARQRAVEFLAKSSSLSRAAVSASEEEVALTLVEAASSEGRYYVFNVGRDEGFVVVGGDDVLGYSERGAFGGEVPENVRGWLDGLAGQDGQDGQDGYNGQDGQFGLGGRSAHIAQTAHIAHSPQPAQIAHSPQLAQIAHSPQPAHQFQPPIHPQCPAIRPLLTTQWAQRAPYNALCPEGTVTGCVATAMAQVMKYHEWPQAATTAIPAYSSYEELPPTTFDWAAMAAGYGGEESAEAEDAVARLMQYCGHGVQMSYGSMSYAFDVTIVMALTRFFGYDGGLHCVYRTDYSAAEWEELICAELQAGRPVIYGAQRPGIGHEFVCDGYDGEGFFHINWGWGGYSDGWYRLTDMLPSYFGTGGGANVGCGFTMYHVAIVGVQPDRGGTPPEVTSLLTAEEMRLLSTPVVERESVDKPFQLNLCCPMCNHSNDTLKMGFGVALMQDGQFVKGHERLVGPSSPYLPGAYTYRNVSQKLTFGAGLTGAYRIVPVCNLKLVGKAELVPALGADTYYVDVVLGETTLALTVHPRRDLEVSDVAFHLTDGTIEATATVTNHGDDFDGLLYLFISGVRQGYTGVKIDAGKSDVVAFRYEKRWEVQDYKICCTQNGGDVLAEGSAKCTVENTPGTFVVWYGDGSSERLAVGDDGVAVVPQQALAVEFGSEVPAGIVASGNPNCLYYVNGSTAATAHLGNVVVRRYASEVTLTDGYAFYCPMSFTAGRVDYERTFSRGYDGKGGGWETIILPFDVQTVTPRGREPVDWFRSAQDAGKDFWLMTYGGGDTFDHAQTMESNRPYLIAVPGPVYGERSLTGIPVTFAADHTVVRQTALTNDGAFVGEYGQAQNAQSAHLDGQDGLNGQSGLNGQFGREQSYQLNVGGSAFVGTTRQEAPFRVRLSRETK